MSGSGPHIPVLIDAILSHCAPISGHWLDGTFGAGGYTRALLEAGADKDSWRQGLTKTAFATVKSNGSVVT